MPPGHDFDDIARRYLRDSLVQKAAGEVLLGLVGLVGSEDVLDLGCGAGQLTRRIASITSGRVVGVDPSPRMIAEAVAGNGGGRIRFQVASGEELAASGEFDAIFCNSALQWFREPPRALAGCYRALRPGGRMAVQAPARHDYCPVFLEGVEAVGRDPATGTTFARFVSPWFFLETSEAYADVFRRAGFSVPFARIEATITRYAPEQVLAVFESGAAAGYLNPDCYDVAMPDGYVESFRRILSESFLAQAGSDGRVDLVFNRLYLLAVKP